MKWIVFLFATSAGFAQSANKCADLTKFKMPGAKIQITSADMVPAGPARGGRGPAGPNLPAHCRVNGIVDQRTGADGKTYGIRFAIALPDQWSGQYLQQGGGGLNGTVGEPIGAQAAGEKSALARGMAVASSDTGHQAAGGGGFDGGFMQDQQAALDFEYVAIGRLAVLSKVVIETYYGRPPDHSYYVGCSTGGREAMVMSQRYPEYFDGIVAGAPAMRTGHSNLATRGVTVALNAVAPKAADGTLGPALSEGDKKGVIAKILEVCDARDGVKDGMIFDVTGCPFSPKDMQCVGAKTDGCLSAQQVAAIEKGFAGPKDSRGRQVYPGFFFDTGITATTGIPGLLNPGPSPLGRPSTNTTQDVDAEAATVENNPTSRIGDSYTWTNLNSFSAHGGKLLFFHGVSDPWFSAKDTIDYYQRMTAANGGAAKVTDWSRLFLSPGMGHCSGGEATLDSFDMLSAAVNWVEKKQAPESVMATGRAFPGRSRPLCAFPAHAQYNGSGNPEDGANYSCRQ
jgi:feruloyl esterase